MPGVEEDFFGIVEIGRGIRRLRWRRDASCWEEVVDHVLGVGYGGGGGREKHDSFRLRLNTEAREGTEVALRKELATRSSALPGSDAMRTSGEARKTARD